MGTKREFEVERIVGHAGHEERHPQTKLIEVVEAETASEALDLVVGDCPEGWEIETVDEEYACYENPDTGPRYSDCYCASLAPGEPGENQ